MVSIMQPETELTEPSQISAHANQLNIQEARREIVEISEAAQLTKDIEFQRMRVPGSS
jgi:hypothetical protein